MKKQTAGFLKAAALLLALLAAWVAFNLYPIARDYLRGPRLAFRENADVALELYPDGRPAANIDVQTVASTLGGAVAPIRTDALGIATLKATPGASGPTAGLPPAADSRSAGRTSRPSPASARFRAPRASKRICRPSLTPCSATSSSNSPSGSSASASPA